MAHKITIVDKVTNNDVTHEDMFFIGTDNKVYRMDDCDCVTVDNSLYWKFDMIEVKH